MEIENWWNQTHSSLRKRTATHQTLDVDSKRQKEPIELDQPCSSQSLPQAPYCRQNCSSKSPQVRSVVIVPSSADNTKTNQQLNSPIGREQPEVLEFPVNKYTVATKWRRQHQLRPSAAYPNFGPIPENLATEFGACTIKKSAEGVRYLAFFTSKFWFSNHYQSLPGFQAQGKFWSSVEKYYMWRKALFFGFHNMATKIEEMENPIQIKKYAHAKNMSRMMEIGAEPHGFEFDPKRWREEKLEIMTEALELKFQNPEMKRKLLNSGEAYLVELSPDPFWGSGNTNARPPSNNGRNFVDLMHDHQYCEHPEEWTGENWLGRALMTLRKRMVRKTIPIGEFLENNPVLIPIGEMQSVELTDKNIDSNQSDKTKIDKTMEKLAFTLLNKEQFWSNLEELVKTFPKQLSQLEEDIDVWYRTKVQSENAYRAKINLWKKLDRHIRTFGNSRIFGSVTTPLAEEYSDVDIVISPRNVKDEDMKPMFQIEVLKMIRMHLQRTEFKEWKKYVTEKGFPKLGIELASTGQKIDLTYGNEVGIQNSEMVNRLCAFESRLAPLAFVVKSWAKTEEIGDAQLHGLNSWTWFLLVVFYLQTGIQPQILPPLEQAETALSGHHNNSNKKSVSELLLGFFWFLDDIPWNTKMISPRTAKLLDKKHGKQIEVEEPLKPERNTARSITESNHREKIEDAAKRAKRRMFSKKNPLELVSLLPSFKAQDQGPYRGHKIQKTIPNILCVVVVLALIVPISAIMICDSEIQRTYYQIQNVAAEACLADREESVFSSLTMFRPSGELIPINASLCRKVHQHISYWENMIGETRSNLTTKVLQTSKEECWTMLKRKNCEFGPLKGSPTASTGLDFEPKIEPSYWSTKEAQVTNCFHTFTTAYLNPWTGSIQSPIGGNEICDFDDEFCQLESGEILTWRKKQNPYRGCKWIKVGSFNGTYSDGIWIREDHQLALSFHSKRISFDDCNTALTMTDQHYAVTSLSYEAMLYEERMSKSGKNQNRQKRSLSGSGIVHSEQLGAVLTLASALEARKHKAMFYNLLCSTQQTVYRTGNPTMVARRLLGKFYLQAHWVGDKDILEVWPCLPVLTYNFTATKIMDQCYKRIPINATFGNQILSGFLDPETLIVTAKSKLGPCSVYWKQTININGSIIKVDQRTGKMEIIPSNKIIQIYPNDISQVQIPNLDPNIFKNLAITNDTTSEQFLGILKSFRMSNVFRGENGPIGNHPLNPQFGLLGDPIGKIKFTDLIGPIEWEKVLIRSWILITMIWFGLTVVVPWSIKTALRTYRVQEIFIKEMTQFQETQFQEEDQRQNERVEQRRQLRRDRQRRARSEPARQ